MEYLFYECSSLKEVDLSNFDTSKLRIIQSLFAGCSSLEKINLSNFNISNVALISALFSRCSSLKEVDLSSFDTSKVTSMEFMFSNCRSLKKLNLSNFNTENVEIMTKFFNNCSSLIDLDISNFNTLKVKNMDEMFYGCSSIKKLDLSNFVTNNVENLEKMFYGCSSLTSINLTNFDTSKVINMYYMFRNCSNLKILDISNFNITDKAFPYKYRSDMFLYSNKIKYINLYNAIDNGILLDSSINKIDNLIVCQKYNIITNPTAQNRCSEYDYTNSNGTFYNIIDTIKFSLSQTIIEDINLPTKITNEIDSTILNIANDSEITKGLNISTIITNEIDSTIIKIVNESKSIKNLSISSIITNEIDSTIGLKDFTTLSIIYPNSTSISKNIEPEDLTNPLTQETIYEINSRVFLLGYTNFNIMNSNLFSFFIYFMAPKNTIFSQILNFPLTIKYKNNLRLLENKEESNCTKVEPKYEEFNKYYCTAFAKTSNIDNIELSTNFNFKPKTIFKSFYYSSLTNKSLDYFQNITSKEYISSEIFLLDNSKVYKYNNTLFEINGVIEKSNPKFKEKSQLLIENNLSKDDKYKKLNCSISHEKSNNYNLICSTNEKVHFNFQGSVVFTGDNIIIINLENEMEKLTFDNSENSEEFDDTIPQRNIKKKNNSSKKWIIIIIIVTIIVILIIIIVIIFVVRKKRNTYIQEQTNSEMNLNQINN